jgi:hypothetical protein
MICSNNQNNQCMIATILAEHPIASNEDTCKACMASKDNPMSLNKITCGLAVLHLAQLKKYNTATYPHIAKCLNPNFLAFGPGTELTNMLKPILYVWLRIAYWLRLKITNTCKCSSYAIQMNQWGPEKCLENIPTILSWLKEGATIYRLPYCKPVALVFVKLAIQRAKHADKQNRNKPGYP